MKRSGRSRWLGLPLGVISIATLAQSALAEQERKPGSSYFQCSIERKFMILDRFGKSPTFRNLARRNEAPRTWPEGTPGPEIVRASAEVEPDGSISKLTMYWLQAGLMGWPYSARVDTDDVYLSATFGQGTRYEVPYKTKPRTTFDPELLVIQIDAYSARKFRHPIQFNMSRKGAYGFGGLADVSYTRKVATVRTSWPELSGFADGSTLLDLLISEIGGTGFPSNGRVLRSTQLDIAPIPLVLEQMRLSEQDLKVLAAQAETRCSKTIVPVPPETSPEMEI